MLTLLKFSVLQVHACKTADISVMLQPSEKISDLQKQI